MIPERLGPYRVLEPLGSGGMGEVYLAEDSRLGRQVALKVLSNSADRVALDRFLREARTTAALQHPNIAVLLDVGEESGVPYLVLERIEGESLRDALERGPLDWQRVLDIAAQIASALSHAHAQGVLHRDIKPGNIMLSPSRGAVLLDFGLVQWLRVRAESTDPSLRPTETSAGLTREGAIAGTALYMSADQLRGKTLDARSDLFQLGIVMYEALTGHHPFDGKTLVDVQHAILHDAPPPLSKDVPSELARVILKLVEKDPDYRYPDARALEVDLRVLRRDSSAEAPFPPQRSRAKHSRLAGTLAVVSVAGSLLLAVALLMNWPGTPRDRDATPARFVPLTQGGGDEGGAAFSPDGKSVVFASDRGGGWELWVGLISGGTPVRITNTPEVESQPTWSPDGTRVAFTRRRATGSGSDIFVMPALGGDARKYVVGASDPGWSPDGGRIAFAESSAGWTRIATIDVEGRASPRPVTELEEGYFHRAPCWTPDGKTIVYARSPGGSAGQLMRVPASGGSPTPVTVDALGTANSDPAVTPDGRHVVHVSDRGGAFNLWRVPLAGGEPQRITSGAGSDLAPSVSPDGRRIAFTLAPRDVRIVAMSRGGGPLKILTELGGTQAWGPDLSPDGSRIAFSLKVPGAPWRLVELPRDGGPWHTVLDGLPDVFGARFLPDSRTLVFHTRLSAGRRLGRVQVDGTELTWLTAESEDASYPSVSPDGRLLAFVRNDGARDTVILRPIEGGEERVVAHNATLPSFSPDGRFLTIARARSYSGGVGVVDIAGGEPRWLTATGTWPTWMPDSETVAFADGGSEGNQQAWAVATSGGPARRLADHEWSGPHWPFVIDPESGELITSNSTENNSKIWLAEY